MLRALLMLIALSIVAVPAFADDSDRLARDAQLAQRMKDLERQNKLLNSQVMDLELEVHDLRRSRRFSVGRLVLTSVISTAAVSASFLAADHVFGASTRKVMPNMDTARFVGLGAALAAGPSLLAGIGSGFRSSAVVTTGITLDTLLAVAPWVAGAAIHAFAGSTAGPGSTSANAREGI